MNFEVGKEYLYSGGQWKLVFIGPFDNEMKFLLVRPHEDGVYHSTWASAGELKELQPPYHNFKRGEPVIAIEFGGYAYRRYFSHVDDKGRPHCFDGGNTAWAVKLKYINKATTVAWDSVRKLTEEEKAEARKDHEVLLQYFSS